MLRRIDRFNKDTVAFGLAAALLAGFAGHSFLTSKDEWRWSEPRIVVEYRDWTSADVADIASADSKAASRAMDRYAAGERGNPFALGGAVDRVAWVTAEIPQWTQPSARERHPSRPRRKPRGKAHSLPRPIPPPPPSKKTPKPRKKPTPPPKRPKTHKPRKPKPATKTIADERPQTTDDQPPAEVPPPWMFDANLVGVMSVNGGKTVTFLRGKEDERYFNVVEGQEIPELGVTVTRIAPEGIEVVNKDGERFKLRDLLRSKPPSEEGNEAANER